MVAYSWAVNSQILQIKNVQKQINRKIGELENAKSIHKINCIEKELIGLYKGKTEFLRLEQQKEFLRLGWN